MKKIIGILFLFLISISNAKTIRVGSSFPVKKVKQALQLAVDGDTIIVNGGVYKEGNILINKKIIFLGKNFPILDGQRKFEVMPIML